jgi:hypothetical protein
VKSTRTQLVVTLVAVGVSVALLAIKGPPPSQAIIASVLSDDIDGLRHALKWGVGANSPGAGIPGPFDRFPPMVWRDTILHTAATQPTGELAELLIAYGADIEARDETGRPALHRAAMKGQKEVVVTLLAHGADVNATDYLNLTPMWYALSNNKTEVAELLRQHGGTQ